MGAEPEGATRASIEVPAGPRSADPATIRWRILRDPPAGGAWNMAVDTALARSLGEAEGVLRIYRWSRPTLSLGRNQRARDRFDPTAALGLGAEIVRRPTGGREVLHDRELTYAVILPLRSFGGVRESYRIVNGALVAALRSLGIPVALARGTGATPPLDSGPCFGAPAEGEVVAEGRKLAGSAQARIGRTLLQHGSLLLAPASLGIEALRAPPPAEGPVGPAEHGYGDQRGGEAPSARGRSPDLGITLSELRTDPVAFAQLAAAVEAAMAGALGGRWRRDELTPAERVVAEGLLPHYESAMWTWRR